MFPFDDVIMWIVMHAFASMSRYIDVFSTDQALEGSNKILIEQCIDPVATQQANQVKII